MFDNFVNWRDECYGVGSRQNEATDKARISKKTDNTSTLLQNEPRSYDSKAAAC